MTTKKVTPTIFINIFQYGCRWKSGSLKCLQNNIKKLTIVEHQSLKINLRLMKMSKIIIVTQTLDEYAKMPKMTKRTTPKVVWK